MKFSGKRKTDFILSSREILFLAPYQEMKTFSHTKKKKTVNAKMWVAKQIDFLSLSFRLRSLSQHVSNITACDYLPMQPFYTWFWNGRSRVNILVRISNFNCEKIESLLRWRVCRSIGLFNSISIYKFKCVSHFCRIIEIMAVYFSFGCILPSTRYDDAKHTISLRP